MATKDYCLSDNADNFFDKSINDDQYSNLNLNHNYQSLNADNKHSKNVTNISRKVQNYDFTNSNDLKAKRNLNSWKKSSNTFSPIFSNLIGESREEEHEFKTLKSANNSTLSLHISAYENLIEADKSDSNELEKEGLKSKDLFKKWGTSKKCFTGSSLSVENSFEFSRQQENQNKRPEVMQFKASQKLRNPNEATNSNNSTTSSQSDTEFSEEQLSDATTSPNKSESSKDGEKSGTTEFRHCCTICDTEKGVNDMIQLLPCMHIFCNECITLHKQLGAKVCPQIHCYSTLQPNEEHRLNLCENDLCAHRFGLSSDLFKLTLCKHEICGNCFEEAVHKDPPLCPIADCGVVLEEDEKDSCDVCKASTENDKLLSTLCCNSIVCQNCFIQAWERTDKPRTSTEVRCPKDECFDKKKGSSKKNQEGGKKGSGKKQVTTPTLAKCKGAQDCARVALRNFPSEQECEHDVCLQCLDRMIADCQVSDSMPMCPNDRCHLPYRFESVAALKALLPDRAKYFAGLALESNQGYEAIKDDSVTPVETCITGFKAKDKILTVKCNVSEDEEGPTIVTYVKDGSLGGFIRELRRAMKIMATDKVYGYFVRRDEGGDEQLVINQSTFQKPISTYKLDSETLIIIDVTGIVMAKTNANKN